MFDLQVDLAFGAVSTIGQNIGAELLRQHRNPLLYLGLVHNAGALVTVDQKAYINLWRYES